MDRDSELTEALAAIKQLQTEVAALTKTLNDDAPYIERIKKEYGQWRIRCERCAKITILSPDQWNKSCDYCPDCYLKKCVVTICTEPVVGRSSGCGRPHCAKHGGCTCRRCYA